MQVEQLIERIRQHADDVDPTTIHQRAEAEDGIAWADAASCNLLREAADALASLRRELKEAKEALAPFCSFGINLDSFGPRGTWIQLDVDPTGPQFTLQDWKGAERAYGDDDCVVTAVTEVVGGNCPSTLTFGDFRTAIKIHGCTDAHRLSRVRDGEDETPTD